jgi:hypothetical protein
MTASKHCIEKCTPPIKKYFQSSTGKFTVLQVCKNVRETQDQVLHYQDANQALRYLCGIGFLTRTRDCQNFLYEINPESIA